MKIVILIPCFNEELTIERVIGDFKAKLSEAQIYVFDNNSTDQTAQKAATAGAIVIKEKRQGKGYVVQAMFKKIDADIYIMNDGDDTYDISEIALMVEQVKNDHADMVVGSRLKNYTNKAFRPLHYFGNKLIRFIVNRLFNANLTDIMSGLRVMNRNFVKNINLSSAGFDVETELTIKALKYGYILKEHYVKYKERPAGSFSKLNTYRDGVLVLKTIATIFKDYRPMLFFSIISAVLVLLSLSSGMVVITEYVETRYIRRVPLAIFATGTMILAMLSFITGIVLDSVNRRFTELYTFIRDKH
ncbi:MAG: glycosyltransferase [Deltaproteobacteria bacterium]|nr:glycosyltransferase [Deltaproteobacteria bacterium]